MTQSLILIAIIAAPKVLKIDNYLLALGLVHHSAIVVGLRLDSLLRRL